MQDLMNVSVIDLLCLFAAFAPIVVLAALAFVDLRALVLIRAASLNMTTRLRPGETRISRDEWAPSRA